MLQIGDMLNFEILIFLLIGLGIYLSRVGLITADFRKQLTDLLLLVILPFNILKSFFIEVSAEVLMSCAAIIVISTGIQIFGIVLGKVAYRKTPPEQQRVLQYATMVSNASLLGMPLILGIYGPASLIYASFYTAIQRVFMWSAGLACFTPVKGKDVLKRVVTHPCVLASIAGVVIMLTGLSLPAALVQTITSVSNCTTAVTMLLVGSILAEVDPRTVVAPLTAYYCLLRLLVIPLCVLVPCLLFKVDPLVTAVSVALSGMPAASTTALMAEKYGADAALGAKISCLSTILSLVTAPALCMFMDRILV